MSRWTRKAISKDTTGLPTILPPNVPPIPSKQNEVMKRLSHGDIPCCAFSPSIRRNSHTELESIYESAVEDFDDVASSNASLPLGMVMLMFLYFQHQQILIKYSIQFNYCYSTCVHFNLIIVEYLQLVFLQKVLN